MPPSGAAAYIICGVQKAIRKSGRQAAIDALRADALADLEVLLSRAAVLRAELRSFEAPLRRARNHLARGGAAADLHDVIDIITARAALTRAAGDFETVRHSSRISIFRMQDAEGMSMGAIARDWGLSRQLVSRMLREGPRAKRSGGS